jgi:hypothetical protein
LIKMLEELENIDDSKEANQDGDKLIPEEATI